MRGARYQTSHVLDRSPLPALRARPRCPRASSARCRLWLGAVALLIVAMILVGGATRLTDSGLSITEWQPILGAVPPLSEADWQKAFEAYQKIPEYTELKRGMSLEEFKTIYWWEWAHRFLGRLIGVAFFVPFVVVLDRGLHPAHAAAAADRPVPARRPSGRGRLVHGEERARRRAPMSANTGSPRISAWRLLILGYTLWLLFGLGAREAARAHRPHARSAAWVAGLVLALIFVQMLAGRAGGGPRCRHGLQHLAADQRRVRAVGPRRSLALVSQSVREPAHRAVRPPHARLCGGAGRARPARLACRERRAAGADRQRA